MLESWLHESFDQPHMHGALRWHCEPARWLVRPAEQLLRVEPDAGTDFWRKTHYGFEVDNGHFLYAEIAGDFVLTTHVRFRPVHQYDQAGLMVRISPLCWLKTSVEHEPDEPSRLGAVVTNGGYSDWSTQEFPGKAPETWLRVRREGHDSIVDASNDGRKWSQIRMAHLSEDREGVVVRAGLYACSPKGSGFAAEFMRLTIERGRLP
jgi:hypothetical protein